MQIINLNFEQSVKLQEHSSNYYQNRVKKIYQLSLHLEIRV